MRYIASCAALLAFAVCASRSGQADPSDAAQSSQAHSEAANSVPAPVTQSPQPGSEAAASAPAPVAQSPETHSEGSALASALSKDTHDEAVSVVSAAAGLPAEGADQEAIDLAKARKLGYRIVDRNGETVYCHDTVATGSHLNKQTICLTRKQWENVSDNAARAMQRMQGVTSPCPNGGACGG
jgi:hypothetical protein